MYNRKRQRIVNIDTSLALNRSANSPLNNVSAGTPNDIRCETLYGKAHFQVRLWTLPPRAVLPPYPLISSELLSATKVENHPSAVSTDQTLISQSFLLEGTLSGSYLDEETSAPLETTFSVPSGQRVQFTSQRPCRLNNTGEASATIIEVIWGNGLASIPLGEVTETRPWGSFTVLKDESLYKLKQLIAKPGNRLSYQRHQHREEHWLVTQGNAEVTLDGENIRLTPGEHIKIPRYSWHRLSNLTSAQGSKPPEQVEIIELQLGDYFGEDDIERQEDDYGRA